MKSMESFGSSLVFVWSRLWHWFVYSLVTVQEFGLSERLLAMPLVVRGWTASLSQPTFWYWDYVRGEVSKMQQGQLSDLPLWEGEWGFVTGHQCVAQCHPHGACRWLTALWVGVQHRNDRGWGSEGGVNWEPDTYRHLRGPKEILF